MTREEIKQSLYEKYIRPTENKTERYIGVEIEMPVVNLSGQATDYAVAQAAEKKAIEHFGFRPVAFDDNGICYSAVREDNGDNISFDCAYNNLELSMGKEQDINELDRRFKEYVSFINAELEKDNHILTGMGINPNYRVNRQDFIPCGRYRMLERYLQKCSIWKVPMYFHPYHGYGAFASASQVQLDVKKDELLDVINAFSMVEPVKSVIFNNSVMEEEPDLLCVRDMFWENSTHGINPHNIGTFDCRLDSVEDLLEYISTTSMFCTEKGDKYINFKPVLITDYMQMDEYEGEYYENGEYKTIKFKPAPEDLKYLRTYKFEDLTYRGTIEFRSVCNQPFKDAMTVAAFHVGLFENLKEFNLLMEDDHVLYHNGYSAGELRKLLNGAEIPAFVDVDGLRRLCSEVISLAWNGLEKRGLHEERYLAPLVDRAENLTSPGKYMVEELKSGKTMNTLVREFAEI